MKNIFSITASALFVAAAALFVGGVADATTTSAVASAANCPPGSTAIVVTAGPNPQFGCTPSVLNNGHHGHTRGHVH